MFVRQLLSFFILIFFYLYTSANPRINDGNFNKIRAGFNPNTNDSILELFNNCTCIPYYQCSQANSFMFIAGSRNLPQNMTCSDSNYFCCKLVSNSVQTNNTLKAIKSSSADDIILKEPVVFKKGCGTPRSLINVRILKSETDTATTIPGELPWVVEILKKVGNSYQYKCSGTLIHPKVVVTATHCVISSKEDSLKIISSSRGLFVNPGTRPEDERTVFKIIKHPKYYSGGLYNDIALLILEKEYNLVGTINSICLPKETDFTGKRCIAVGWSNTTLNKVDVPIDDFKNCQNLLRMTYLGTNFSLDSSFICAGGEKGKDTCKGDGGGPLICMGEGYKYVLTGIVSWGVKNNCGVENQPGIYTDVTKFKSWIVDELSKNHITVE